VKFKFRLFEADTGKNLLCVGESQIETRNIALCADGCHWQRTVQDRWSVLRICH